MTTGLTPAGFIAKTQQEVVADMTAAVLAQVDAGLDVSPDQPLGQVIGIFAEKVAEVWEAAATIYNSMNPAAAEGALLANLCALTGTRPQVATFSKVVATINLNAGVTVPIGAVAAVAGQPGNTWTATTSTTNSGGSPANFTVTFQSAVPGPFVANAGTLTVLVSSIVGWNSITNVADAQQGLAADTDTTLRVKRQGELAASGASTTDSIRAHLLAVAGVIQAFVFENTSGTTDSTGLPGHSIRVVVWDGASPVGNNALAQVIWNNKPSGIGLAGSTSGTAVDSAGVSHTVRFDRAAQVPIYFSLTTSPGALTTAQTAAVKAALAAYGTSVLNLGVSVVALAFQSQALQVAGVLDVPTFFLGTAPSPGGTANIAITGLQIATVSTTNILVNGV